MLKSKILALGLAAVVAAGLLVGCGKSQDTSSNSNNSNNSNNTSSNTTGNTAKKYQDGIYFAQEDGFSEKSGWKYMVTIEVKDGKIVKADWNGAHKKAGADKKTVSKEGKYGMVEKGKAQAEWHDQAKKVEDYLLEKQEPVVQYKDDEGHTDAISGATIGVKEFFDLAKKALDKGPVGSGQYKDGSYHVEGKEFSEKSGWKETLDLTVVNGYIVAVDWNGVHKDGGDDKDTVSQKGDYGMVAKGGAKAEWHEQAQKVEAYLLEKQDPAAPDAISGATISFEGFFGLAKEALESAKK
ncbi:MAG: FMN-binding protein [Bacillota bacterium]